VVCVDNGSSDRSPDEVAATFPDVQVLRLPGNLGFAGGMNVGLRAALEAGADYAVTLNNDLIVEPGFAEPLVVAAGDPKVAAVSSQILFADPPDRIWYAGARFRPGRGHHGRNLHYGKPPLARETPPYATDRACGATMLVPRSALEGVGLFDESLFAYFEDVDWSLRARARGLSVLVVPASVVRHKVSAASGGEASATAIYYSLRNGLVVAERHAPLGRVRTLCRRAEAVLVHVLQAVLFSSRRGEALRAVVRAWRDFRGNRVGGI
jgi:GT2 family glycosyltransferase